MNKQHEMSGYEYAQANRFIDRLYRKYRTGLEFEECRSIAFLEYVEARSILDNYYNTEALWMRAAERIISAFRKARKVRNEKISMESRLSLDQCYGESQEPVYTFLYPGISSFEHSACLWLDLKQLEPLDYRILSYLYRGADDWEIINQLNLSTLEYFERKSALREKLQAYFDEWFTKEDGAKVED